MSWRKCQSSVDVSLLTTRSVPHLRWGVSREVVLRLGGIFVFSVIPVWDRRENKNRVTLKRTRVLMGIRKTSLMLRTDGICRQAAAYPYQYESKISSPNPFPFSKLPISSADSSARVVNYQNPQRLRILSAAGVI